MVGMSIAGTAPPFQFAGLARSVGSVSSSPVHDVNVFAAVAPFAHKTHAATAQSIRFISTSLSLS